MKILVTGGAGFIGSHLCEYFLNQGNEVVCLDNFFTSSRDNVKHLMKDKKFKLIEDDVCSPFFMKVNQIYNLACPASPVHYQRDPVKTVQTNVLGAINVLEVAKKNGIRVFQASTSEVYGDPKEHPQKEDYFGNVNCLSPRACYDEGKRCAETLFMDYHRELGIDIKIVRIFNTYGPKMALDDGRVISNFIVQALKGKDITIYGDGSQTRSFQYISDLIKGMVRVMDINDNFTGPINLGNPEEVSVKDIAEKILTLTKSKSKLTYRSLPEADPVKRCPDISLAKKILKWEPKISLDEGLKKTIDYFRKKL